MFHHKVPGLSDDLQLQPNDHDQIHSTKIRKKTAALISYVLFSFFFRSKQTLQVFAAVARLYRRKS